MRLYNALTFLQDAGLGDEFVSAYEIFGAGIIITVNEALEEQSYLAQKLSVWFDRPVIREPHVDQGGRIVLCLGGENGAGPESEWDGFWEPSELPYVYDEYEENIEFEGI